MTLPNEKYASRLTWGLALLGQDVVILIISNMPEVIRAERFPNLPTTPSPDRYAACFGKVQT